MPKVKMNRTEYQGLVVTQDQHDELMNQPVSDVLRFVPAGSKYVMQAKLPEMGMYHPEIYGEKPEISGQPYRIRVNMNYLTRGMMRYVMDENGNIDARKRSELENRISELGMPGMRSAEAEAKLNRFITDMDVPKDKQGEFKLFLKANGLGGYMGGSLFANTSTGPIYVLNKELDQNLIPYQRALNEPNPSPEMRTFLENNREHYENMHNSFKEMREMDPETETRIMFPTDCRAYAYFNKSFIDQANQYKKTTDPNSAPIDYEMTGIHLKQNEFKEANRYKAFDVHFYTVIPVRLDGENVAMSLESTAMPDGEMFHCPGMHRTGVGIFDDKASVEKYHQAHNLRFIPNKEVYNEVKKKMAGADKENVPALGKTYHRYIQLHSGEYVSGMSRKDLEKCAAKCIAAKVLMDQPADKQKPFSVDAVRKEASSIMAAPNFKAALRAVSTEKLKEVMVTGDSYTLTKLLVGDKKRYAAPPAVKKELRSLTAGKNIDGSKNWKRLQDALEDPEMSSTSEVFDRVENYLKGKEKPRKGPESKEKFKIAMDALAIAARNGDAVAKKRAQDVVDRINTVRKAKAGSENYVSLNDYGKAPVKNEPEKVVLQMG